MRLADYLATLKTSYGNQSPTTETSAEFLKFVNTAYEEVARIAPEAFWLQRYFTVITLARGTGAAAAATGVSLTGGSAVATFGASSRLDRRIIGAMLRVGTDQETYLIRDVTSVTTAIIDPPYTGATLGAAVSNSSWEIVGYNYRLPPDSIAPFTVKQSTSPAKMIAVNPRDYERLLPDPVLLGQRGTPFYYCIVYGGGLPDLWGSDVQQQLGGTAGNVTVVNGSTALIGGSQTPDFVNAVVSANASAATSFLPSMFIRVANDTRYYRIRTVSSGTAMVLDEPYRGTSATNQNFKIMPGDAPWIRFFPLPDSRIQADVEYHASPAPLQSNEEEPRLPMELHRVVQDGALVRLYQFMREFGSLDRAKQDYALGLSRAKALADGDDEVRWTFKSWAGAYEGGGNWNPAGFFIPFSVTT